MTDDVKLPPLPPFDYGDGHAGATAHSSLAMEIYARDAILADREARNAAAQEWKAEALFLARSAASGTDWKALSDHLDNYPHAAPPAKSDKSELSAKSDAQVPEVAKKVHDALLAAGRGQRELTTTLALNAAIVIEQLMDAPQAPAIPADPAGEPKLAATWLERQCVQVLNDVKAWRDSDGNEGFPQATREAIDILLMTYEQRRYEPCKSGDLSTDFPCKKADLSTIPADVLALLTEARDWAWRRRDYPFCKRIDAVLERA